MAQEREVSPLEGVSQNGQKEATPEGLFLLVEANCSLKMGTCEHCVFEEQGRPERAWDANGDQELDFPRDAVFSALEEYGIVLERQPPYVCP